MKKISIAIDGRPFSGPTNGFTVYLTSVLKTLRAAHFDITLVASKPYKPEHTIAKEFTTITITGKMGRFWWEQWTLLRFLQKNRYDIYFTGYNTGLPILYLGKTKLMLGLLDLIPLKFKRLYLFAGIKSAIRSIFSYLIPQYLSAWKADKIITISKASMVDIEHYFPGKEVAYSLIKLEVPTNLPKIRKAKRQFVYVGGVDARKRIDVVIKAFAQFLQQTPGYKLILIGRGYEVFESLIAELGVKDSVVRTGYISDEEKMNIIADSQAMVYPSLYEGYGLAIAEAFLCNTPVICGTGGSQAEVGGKGVITIDPTSTDQVAEAIQQVVKHETAKRLEAGMKSQLKLLTSPEIDRRVAGFFTNLAQSRKEDIEN